MEQGHSDKTSIGWGVGGGAFSGGFAAGGVGSHTNTDVGQVVAMACLDAHAKVRIPVPRTGAWRSAGERSCPVG